MHTFFYIDLAGIPDIYQYSICIPTDMTHKFLEKQAFESFILKKTFTKNTVLLKWVILYNPGVPEGYQNYIIILHMEYIFIIYLYYIYYIFISNLFRQTNCI